MMGHIKTHKRDNLESTCDNQECKGKIQASCFTCSMCFCFRCSLAHVQSYKSHEVLQLDDSVRKVSENSGHNLKYLQNLKQFIKSTPVSESENESKLHPEKFQQQLDQITFMKKQTLKIVDKFFSEISLQIVNTWQNYLKRYSGQQGTMEIYNELQTQMYRFIKPNLKNEKAELLVKQYFLRNLQGEVKKLRNRLSSKDVLQIPHCPQLLIQERVLVEIAELLCTTISTKNYSSNPSSEYKINITRPNYLQNNIKCLPIFPIKRPYCYLYDLTDKVYEIQQFDKLEILPSYPKSIILPNGDLHLIGGQNADGTSTDIHIVYRSSTSQIFKLSTIPTPCNPNNSLLYRDGLIFLIGGIDSQGQWSNKCHSYNLKNKQWNQLTSMSAPKPHQSAAVFNDQIYAFGIPESEKINIQKYSINQNKWQQIYIQNLLSNPYNFAAGFMAIQINSFQILLYGGKKFLESTKSKKRSTDRVISPNMYIFRPQNNSFVQLGALNPCLGVQYGEINPIIQKGKVYSVEFLVSKNQPIVRWYETMQVTQISQNGTVQSVMVLHQE